jgi:hypothetical protein
MRIPEVAPRRGAPPAILNKRAAPRVYPAQSPPPDRNPGGAPTRDPEKNVQAKPGFKVSPPSFNKPARPETPNWQGRGLSKRPGWIILSYGTGGTRLPQSPPFRASPKFPKNQPR